MPVVMSARAAESSDTQLHTIRDLMLSAAQRGAWMTLGEIAGLTEIGEASISAQLRHLRKSRHGRHRVEKRRRIELFRNGRPRAAEAEFTRRERRDARRREGGAAVIWEYRVLPPAGWESPTIARCQETMARPQAPNAACASEEGAGTLTRNASEVSDAKACN